MHAMSGEATFAAGQIEIEMIQRLQSVFLLLCSAALGGSYALPFADSATKIPNTIFADGLFTASDSMPITLILGLAALVSIAAIFLYNNRKLQMKVVLAGILLIILGIGYAVGFFMKKAQEFGEIAIDDEPGMYLPIAALVLAFLANRFINKDEKLVRSADRLR